MPPLHLRPILTPSLLHSLRNHPHIPKQVWYYVTGVTLSALNRPDEVPNVLIYALDNASSDNSSSSEEHVHMARRMRESLLKSAAVVGMPKTINALLALKAATPLHLLDEPLSFSPSGRRTEVYDGPPSTILQRGQTFFDGVYGKASKRIMGQMDRSGTEDLGLAARLVYGYVVSNEKVLDARETSFVLMAGLIPQDVNRQLKGHLRGALNNGATVQEVQAVREVVIRICQAAGMKRLDEDAAGGWGWREEVTNL